MVERLLGVVGFVLISLVCASQGSAELLCGFFKGVAADVKHRQCWPDQFVPADQAAARAPFCTMVSNGWRRQNMLGEVYFKPNTSELTEAGRQKVRWILVNAPKQHRFIFVHEGETPEETSARLAAVAQVAGKIAPNDVPPILPTAIADDGWPAAEVGAIGRKYMQSIPNPRLSPSASSGNGNNNGMAPAM